MTLPTATKLARTLDSGRAAGEATPEVVGGGDRSEEEMEEQRSRSEAGAGDDAALTLLSYLARSERTSVPMSCCPFLLLFSSVLLVYLLFISVCFSIFIDL